MAKRNHRTTMVEDTCNVCGRGKGAFLYAKTPRFKAGKVHSTGPCNECQTRINGMVDQLIAGGTLCVCKNCRAVSVVDTIPEILNVFLTRMPDGTQRLELPNCPLCTKEAESESNEAQSP